MVNNLDSKPWCPGNPNVRQTLLAKAYEGYHHVADPRARKRQKLDVSSAVTLNGASSSYARGPAPRNNVPEPDIQLIETPRATNNRSHTFSNDAEIIDLEVSSDEVGEPVPRPAKSSSPDPINMLSHRTVHAFDTYPAGYTNKGKSRAKESPNLFVEGSEGSEDIEEFTSPPPMGQASNTKKSEIPKNIVPERVRLYESARTFTPAAVRHPAEKVVNSIDSTTAKVIGRMKKKGEGIPSNRRSTDLYDHMGTSSSNFMNSSREKEKVQTLPLKAWCLGHHLFQHPESAPLRLTYEVARQRIKVIWGRSPLKEIDFQLDRDVCSIMIVNDSSERLRENVVLQLTTTQSQVWKEAERKYKGFKGGGDRGKEVLAFLFSTAEDRGFSTTNYQKFAFGIRKAFSSSAVEIIEPSKGGSIWEYASRHAAMFEQTESRKGKAGHSESIADEQPELARSVTPGSSTSVKTRTYPESKPSNGDSGPSMAFHCSARQSATRSSRTSPPLPLPTQLEPDEVILMYPPTGTGALSIMQSDLRRLQPEEYLNDTLIEFGLKLWLNDLREKDPALADQIHVFSSFFYKKLNNRKSPEDGYKSVRKWTSKVNLFAKKYVIVPINENIHWYLAIICEPGHTLEAPFLPARMTRKRRQKQIAKGKPEANPFLMDAARATTPSTVGNEELRDVAITVSDNTEAVSAASSDEQIRDSSPLVTPELIYPPSDSMDVDTDISVTSAVSNTICETTSKPSSGIPASQFYRSMPKSGDVKPVVVVDNEDSGEDQQQEAEVDNMLAVTQSSSGDLPPQTYIFTLDSLGTRHPQAIKVLRQYLTSEAKDKRNYDEVRDAVGKQVQVPVQPNTWDCGVYLLHFMKVFMSAPSEFLDQILSTRGTIPSSERKKMWQDHEIPQFRDNLKSRILQLSEEWKAEKREEEASKRRGGDALEVEALSSEGEVDIVEDLPSAKAIPGSRQKQPAARLRG
ncbi:hypothetical protein J3R82DRAFT_9723 [Butyriboletus roseoflavus]|nr:hypothetical protein J3R82DRAFT_9723 [Butyriboletus roseoflavus]